MIMTVWKLGCRWGHGKPLFFGLLINYQIVISSPDKRFAIGDWVVLTDGFTVLGFAEVIGKPLPIADNELLKSELNKRVVNGYPAPIVDIPLLASEFGKRDVPNNVDVYDANVWELAVEDQFRYQNRQGIVQIHNQKILDDFDKIREKYQNNSRSLGRD